jgi:hypothetical protein
MAIRKLDASGEPEEVGCNWCGKAVTPGDCTQYGENYHICDACTLKFGERASVIIESNPDVADKVEEQIQEEAQQPEPEEPGADAQTEVQG